MTGPEIQRRANPSDTVKAALIVLPLLQPMLRKLEWDLDQASMGWTRATTRDGRVEWLERQRAAENRLAGAKRLAGVVAGLAQGR